MDLRKIVIAGAGAYHFAPAILEDLFVRFRMNCEVWCVDADLDMAELTARGAQALARGFGTEARFYYTTQLKKAVFGADAVIVCADFLSESAWKSDYEMLDEVGLGKQVRLYGGLGGLMQTLRVGDFMAKLAEEMQEFCDPSARLILCDSSFGGMPLGRMCDAMSTMYGIPTLGISGMSEYTQEKLGLYLEVPREQLRVVTAGLSSFQWVTELTDLRSGESLIERCKKEMQEDSREELAAQYIDFYDAIPAGTHCMQYELLADTPLSPRRTVIYSGVGAGDYELRKRNLALLTVHGPLTPKGAAAWSQIRTSGLNTVHPVEVLRALWEPARSCTVSNLCMPCDGAVSGVPVGRFVEGPAEISGGQVRGIPAAIPVELEDVCSQISLCNRLYAEAAVSGNRDALREGMEIDPALTGIDLLYAEDVLERMMERQKEALPRFFESA
ncbi:MAG: hypothetical protein IJ242_13880 [Clostridia bacterium]|nr:hypothetical protein [Clostridia bacterium]